MSQPTLENLYRAFDSPDPRVALDAISALLACIVSRTGTLVISQALFEKVYEERVNLETEMKREGLEVRLHRG